MKSPKLLHVFSKATWRDWLGTLEQWAEAMDLDEFDLLERRIRSLETQVLELRARTRKP